MTTPSLDSKINHFNSIQVPEEEEATPVKIRIVKNRHALNQRTFIQDKVEKLMSLQKTLDPVLKHNHSSSRLRGKYDTEYFFPEYNFSSIASIFEGDSLANKAFERQEILCTKEGWDLVSENQKSLEYIKYRLNEIGHSTKISFDSLISRIISDLIRFNNCFIALVRDKKKSSGNISLDGNTELQPIAGFFPIPIETVKLAYDQKGNISSIQQFFSYSGENVKFGKNNYLHFSIGYQGGHSVALPSLVPASDDLIALRQQEENMLIQMHQFLYPTYVYTVGTEDQPCQKFPSGLSELDEAADNVANTPVEGFLFVPERHKLEVMGAKNHTLDPMPSTEYLKKRFFAGSSVSPLDMGEGDTANRSTSDNLSQTIMDRGKYIHRVVSRLVLEKIIIPLLKESTFGPEILETENLVYLKFRQIDIESQIKTENHYAQLYSQHGITIDEFRESIGRDEMTDEKFQRTYYKMVEEPKLLLQAKSSGSSAEAMALAENPSSAIEPKHIKAEQQAEEKKAKEEQKQQKALAAEKNRGQKSGAARQQPSNQYGKKSGPERRKSSFSEYLSDMIDKKEETIWDKVKRDLLKAKTEKERKFLLGMVISVFKDKLIPKIHSNILKSFFDNNGNRLKPVLPSYVKTEIDKYVSGLFDRIREDILKKIKDQESNRKGLDILDSFDYRFKLINDTELKRAKVFGELKAFYSKSIKEVSIKKIKDGTIIKKIKTNIEYKFCPPVLHPNSDEAIEISNEE